MLRLKSLTFDFGSGPVLDDITLEIGDGQFLCVLGPSGCGKTTLLNCIAGFYKPTSGEIVLNGTDVVAWPPESRNFGVVFQDYALFPHMTTYENLAFGLRVRRMSDRDIRARVHEMASLVGLGEFVDRYPHQLSGGQRQRVALARALAPDPALLLLDEPLTALDRALRVQLQDELRRLHRLLGITIIMVTHDPEEAMSLSDSVVLLAEGRVMQSGPPVEVYEAPASALAMTYLGRASELEGNVTGTSNGVVTIALEGLEEVLHVAREYVRSRANVGSRVRVMMRPDRLAILGNGIIRERHTVDASHHSASQVGALRGEVEDLVHKGSWVDVVVRLPDGHRVVVAVNSTHEVLRTLEVSHPTWVEIPHGAVHCYETASSLE